MSFYRRTKKFLFASFVGAILICLAFSAFFGEWLSIVEIQQYASSLGLWLPASFIIFYVLISIFFPSTPFMFLAGFLFGFKSGLFYVTLAGFLSAFLSFHISRSLGKSYVDESLKSAYLDKLEKLDEKAARHGFLAILILRILPVMPFNILNVLSGVSKIKTKDYYLGTFLGLAPSNVLAVYFGSFIVSALR